MRNPFSEKEAVNLALRFLDAAKKAVVQDLGAVMRDHPGWGIRITPEFAFVVSPQFAGIERELVRNCIRSLGPAYGSEKEIADTLWKAAEVAIRNGGSDTEFVPSLRSTYEKHLSSKYWHIVRNPLVVFSGSADVFTIGPVAAMTGSDAAALCPKHPQVRILQSETHMLSKQGVQIEFGLPPVVWRVQVQGAKENAAIEAAWLVDIALSLLRLHLRIGSQSTSVQLIGEIEGHPINIRQPSGPHLTTTETGFSIDPMGTIPPALVIDQEVRTIAASADFVRHADAIFGGDAKSLSARFAQGLGWMSRGRRAADRSERMLYFFTAIESLLTSDDKNEPVVQNIARNAAAIIYDDYESRTKFAADLKKLYSIRSALIHAGKRGATIADSNEAQAIAELLHLRIMERSRLDIPFSEFTAGVQVATYGARWPAQAPVQAQTTHDPGQ